MGIASGLIFVAWALVYNLAVAHYRDQLRFDPFAATRLALDSLVANPIGLADIESWALFTLGLLFSFLAMFDGTRWDDPIPGYSQAHRLVLKAREQYQYEVETLTRSGSDIHREARQGMEQTIWQSRNETVSLTNWIATKATLLANIKRFIEYHEGCCNALIKKYRDDNRRFRLSPPPEYFQQRWQHPIAHDFERDLDIDRRKQKEQEEAAAQVIEGHDNMRKALSESIEWFFGEVRKLQDPLIEGWEGVRPNGKATVSA